MNTSPEPLIEIESVSKHFDMRSGGRRRRHDVVRAVNDVSLTIRPGEVLGVVGESGCGKSTLARLLLGLVPLTAGSIRYRGEVIDGQSVRRWAGKLQLVFQDPYSSLDPRMSVRRSLEEPLRIHTTLRRRDKLARAEEMLDMVQMSRDALTKYPHEFSGGQRQRLGIARALMLNPEFIVCDEPVSALDMSVQAQILNLFGSLKDELGLTYFFVSHDLAVIHHISDRVAVMYLGSVVELATRDQFFSGPRHPYSQALMDAVPKIEPGPIRVIEGEMPSPLDPPAGCPFRTRCPLAMPICAEVKPQLQPVDRSHDVACHAVNSPLVGAPA